VRTTEAARYARWAARIAALLVLMVAGVYGYRAWQAARARRKAPPPPPPTVQQQSAEFSFSKVEKDRTLFTLRASRTTEFKDQNKSLLEDVWITIYGRESGRFDNIHTRQCDYDPNSGRIACLGAVQLELESAEAARQRPGQRVIHVDTRSVSFDRETGEARTDAPVTFRFPYGEGRADGVLYRTREATVELQRNVELTLSQQAKTAVPIKLTGRRLEYSRRDRTLRLFGPARVMQGNRELDAGDLVLELDEDLRARRAVATGEPKLLSLEPRGRATLEADRFESFFNVQGWAERLQAQGHVRGSRATASGSDEFEAQDVQVEMSPGGKEPRKLTAEGEVQVRSAQAGRSQSLATASLQLLFSARARGGRRIESGETLAPGTIEWKTPQETTRIEAQRFSTTLDDRNHLQQLLGHDRVEVHHQASQGLPLITNSQELAVKYSGGDWSEMEQSGNVRFRQGDRTAEADRAQFTRRAESVALSGSASVADGQSRTAAEQIWIGQPTGEIRAQGNVRTSYFPGKQNGIANLAPEPAHITAAKLEANSSTGHAVYSGAARLWQGDAVIEANSIELVRDEKRLEAQGNVRIVFPQSPGPSGSKEGPTLWNARAARLTYGSGEGRAHLDGGVSAQSRDQEIDARAMDLFLTATQGGPQQLSRAVATGQVVVRQGQRRGTSERAEYTAAEGKFVLSGGRPTLYDASRGTTTGRQLTFFLANDKILVDSDSGSRTVTMHRVEK
jgi:lipopolysaccharide export system protein LptA